MRSIVDDFLAFAIEAQDQCDNANDLVGMLDDLASAGRQANPEADSELYPDSPDASYQEIEAVVARRFPWLGYYCTVDGEPADLSQASLLVGDAVDDLADIVIDLLQVQWRFENTSESDALWSFSFLFQCHWGRHLRQLQLYLHKAQYPVEPAPR